MSFVLPNGRSRGLSSASFDPRQLARGTRVELEHTTDRRIAQRIAMDHLTEDPAYYEKLARIHLDGLGATPVSLPSPAAGKPQAPIFPLVVGNNGAFLAVRSSPAQGACGVSGYPCRHPGVDANGPAGTPVRAPENGIIVNAADGSVAPFRGYGPWLVVLRGLATGKFHLLSHLDPAARNLAPIGLTVSAGTVIGKTSSANHTHWEVRKKLVPDFARGETNATNNTDPLGWLSSAAGSAFLPIVVVCSVAVLVYLRTRK